MLIGILNLAHSGRTSPDTTTHVHVSAVSQEREDERGDESGPAEPEEGGGGLGFAAALFGVGGAVGDVVGKGVELFGCVLAWGTNLGLGRK